MNLEMLRAFFLWCTVLNGGLLVLSALLLLVAGDWVYRMHSRWFPMPRADFNRALYVVFGTYKILVLTFHVVPWLALAIIG